MVIFDTTLKIMFFPQNRDKNLQKSFDLYKIDDFEIARNLQYLYNKYILKQAEIIVTDSNSSIEGHSIVYSMHHFLGGTSQ